MSKRDVRWIEYAQAVVRYHKSLGSPCYRCGKEIDYFAPVNSKWDATAEHVISLAEGGELFPNGDFSPENPLVSVSHRSCNSRYGGYLVADDPVLRDRRVSAQIENGTFFDSELGRKRALMRHAAIRYNRTPQLLRALEHLDWERRNPEAASMLRHRKRHGHAPNPRSDGQCLECRRLQKARYRAKRKGGKA